MKMRLFLIALLVLALFLTACSSSLTGTWKGKLTDGKTTAFLDYSLELKADGTGSLSGSLGDSATGMSVPIPKQDFTYTAKDGKLNLKNSDGNPISLGLVIVSYFAQENGYPMEYTLSGNTLTIKIDSSNTLTLRK